MGAEGEREKVQRERKKKQDQKDRSGMSLRSTLYIDVGGEAKRTNGLYR